jgi:hypothetical protein
MFFFDDWMLHAREGLDRKQGQPKPVKAIQLEYDADPDLKSIRGIGPAYDDRLDCFYAIADCHDQSGRRFMTRLEMKDPYNWPRQTFAPGSDPLWKRAGNTYMDQHGNPLTCFNVYSLAGTPLEDKGSVALFFDYGEKHSQKPYTEDIPSACVGFSQDGLHFEVEEETLWIQHHSDTGNPPIWNPWTEEFLIYCRPEQSDRRVCVLTTTDFKTFTPPRVILQPDALDPVGREFYGLGPKRYEDIFVGLLSIYDSEPTEKAGCKFEGTNEMQVAYSYNGYAWHRSFRETFIGRTDAGSPMGGQVYAGLVGRTSENRLMFAGMASWGDHGEDIQQIAAELKRQVWISCIYEMRLDGFAYLRTRARQGLIRTKPVVPQGGDLTVNARMTPSGHLKVAVLDTNFNPLPNYTIGDAVPVTGDELFGKVSWQERKNLDELKGKSVILEVQIREGELYAMRFPYQVHLGEYPRDRV